MKHNKIDDDYYFLGQVMYPDMNILDAVKRVYSKMRRVHLKEKEKNSENDGLSMALKSFLIMRRKNIIFTQCDAKNDDNANTNKN